METKYGLEPPDDIDERYCVKCDCAVGLHVDTVEGCTCTDHHHDECLCHLKHSWLLFNWEDEVFA